MFWESGTRIGCDIPALVVTDEGEEGIAYPMIHSVDYLFESGSPK